MARTKQQGFSLVSVLVGLVIGLFVIAGATNIYVDSETTSQYHEAMAAMHDNARFALQDLRNTVILTGRKVSPAHRVFGSVRANNRKVVWNAQFDNTDGAGTAPDTLVVSYAAGQECGAHTEVDDGNPLTQDMMAFELFVDANNNLVCRAYTNRLVSTERTLVGGIQNMQVLYGVDTDSDGAANRYANATIVASDDVWDNVVSVRIGLLVSSGEFRITANDSSDTATNYLVLDTTIPIPANDPQLYRVYTTTISLRNLSGLSRQAGI